MLVPDFGGIADIGIKVSLATRMRAKFMRNVNRLSAEKPAEVSFISSTDASFCDILWRS